MNNTLAAVSLFATLIAAPALADLPPPETAPCDGKAAGQACTYQGAQGTCQDSTCSRLDYSHLTDAGAPSSTIQYACLKCITTGTVTPNPEDDAGGCSTLGGGASAKELGALALAGTFAALIFLKGRRRSS